MTYLYDALFHTDGRGKIALESIKDLHGHIDLNTVSNYYDLDTYKKLASHDANNINILHINFRTLPQNTDGIIVFLKTFNTTSDTLGVTLTWLNRINNHTIQLPGYHPLYLVRTNRAQGVTIFIL